MTTRTVTGTIRHANGTPWTNAVVKFQLLRGSYTALDSYPADAVEATTNASGVFSTALWANSEGVAASAWLCSLPNNETFPFVLGSGAPIDIAALRAATETATWNADTVATLVDAYVVDMTKLAETTLPLQGDALIGYRHKGTGAIGRTLHDRMGDLPISIRDYGAVGNGTTDDSAAIGLALQAAIDATQTGGEASLYFPPGIYLIKQNAILSSISQNFQGPVHFQGAGTYSSILKLESSGSPLWFYDNVNVGKFWYSSFSDLAFAGTRDDPNTNGFRIWSGGHENGFAFHRCRFYDLQDAFKFDGAVNNDSHRFFNCRFRNIAGKTFHLNNPNALCIELYGTNIEVVRGDIFYVAAGGDIRMYGGSIVLGEAAAYLTTDAYIVHLASGASVLGNYLFDGIRVEQFGTGAKIAKIEGPLGNSTVQFLGADLQVMYGGEREAVTVDITNKQVVFERCILPNQWRYRLTGSGQSAGYGLPGRILLADCSVPRGIWQQVDYDAGAPYARFEVRNGYRTRPLGAIAVASIVGDGVTATVTTSVAHGLGSGEAAVLTSAGGFTGVTSTITLDATSPFTKFSYPSSVVASVATGSLTIQDYAFDGIRGAPKGVGGPSSPSAFVTQIGTGTWPDNDATNSPERYVILPPYARIKSIWVRKAARSGIATNYQLFVGNGDKSTTYGSSTLGRQDAEHVINVPALMKAVGTDLNTRTVRIWANPVGITAGHALTADDWIIVEYL